MKRSQPPLPIKPTPPRNKPTPDQPPNQDAGDYVQDGFSVHIIRSTKRKRTVSARLMSWREIEVRAPALIAEKELRTIVLQLIQRVIMTQGRQRQASSDDALQKRAEELNRTLFGGALKWQAIGYVANQQHRYGSCTPSKGTIRISDRLKEVPDWVRDYVIVHELAHLLEPRHNTAFWQLTYRYAKAERARGFLMALQFEESNDNTGEIQKE
ncbi:MAG: M48 metallopeptidase family protein [Anaerolineae bacterium]